MGGRFGAERASEIRPAKVFGAVRDSAADRDNWQFALPQRSEERRSVERGVHRIARLRMSQRKLKRMTRNKRAAGRRKSNARRGIVPQGSGE